MKKIYKIKDIFSPSGREGGEMKIGLHVGGCGDIFLKFEPEYETEESLIKFVCTKKLEPTFTGTNLLLKTDIYRYNNNLQIQEPTPLTLMM